MTTTNIKISHSGFGLGDHRAVLLDGSLMKRWKISPDTVLTLQVGGMKEQIRALASSRNSGLRLHPVLAGRLGLPEGTVFCTRFRASNQTLSLGPVICVLLSRIGTNPERPFGSVTSFCRELTVAASRYGGLVYFIGADRLPESGPTLTGWTYDAGWRKGSFPPPDVVYNRLTSRVVEKSKPVQQFLQSTKARLDGGIFNERYLDKAEVFQALGQTEGLAHCLPESRQYQGSAMLRSMLGRHHSVFLKPVLGSLGKGIIRVRGGYDGSFDCEISDASGKIHRRRFAGMGTLLKGLATHVRGRRYIIQEGLDLIGIEGCAVDFRALVQRDGKGMWDVTSIVARRAARGTFVSNLARGGKLYPVREALALSNLPAPMRGMAASRLRSTALQIADGIEKNIDAHFAELGIDLAVDTRGRVMLLEVNSKPSKEDNTPLGSDDNDGGSRTGDVVVRPSVKRVVQYARHLAKF